MPKCKNDVLISKIGLNKIAKTMEVDFDVFRRMPDCNRINARGYYSAATTPTYDRWHVPEDVFECDKTECVNTGTLSGFGANVVYAVQGDASEWAAGFITFYALTASSQSVSVAISDSDAFTNSDTYTAVATAGMNDSDSAFTAYVVDLSQTPASSAGTGWSGTGNIAYIKFTGTNFTGLSSIAIFNDILDFNVSNVVKVGCLTGIDGSFDLDVAEATCFNPASYDMDALTSIERTITGNSVTANYMLLNPLISRGKEATSFDIETIEATAVDVGAFAAVPIQGLDETQCGRIAVSVDGVCAPHDGILYRIGTGGVVLGTDQFALVSLDGVPNIIVNEVLAGKKLIISYPKAVVVEAFDICAENLETVRTRMTYVKCHTDGARYRFVYDNVLVTSFPDSITNDGEQEFSFTITILKGKDGCFGHVYRILEDAAVVAGA